MNQPCSLNEGLKYAGVKSEHAVNSDIEHLQNMETFSPLDANKLTKKDRLEALASLMFLTEKRDVIIKRRTCADGRKKLSYIKREDGAYPVVSLQAIM